MSSTRALTDDQVQGELKKMEAFITKEAEEKAKEIKLKADEEYEIEKASIVRSEMNNIDETYEAKFKKATLAQQISKSTISNKSRLKVLAQRDESLGEIFDAAEDSLKELTKDKSKYKSLLVGLIEEAALELLEPTVTIKSKKGDLSLVKEAAVEAAKKYTDLSGRAIKITVDESDYLSDNLAGGVSILDPSGKIEINNTLEERLKLLSETALPAVRLEVFGISPSRKFFD